VTFGSLTSVILAIQPIADEKQVVLINSSAISPNIREKADNFLFSLMVNGETEAKFIAKELQAKFPNEKIVVFYSNNTSGLGTKDVFVQELEALGNTNVHSESYELGATDFKIQLDKIKKSQSKYGYLIANSNNEFADILKQAKELNLNIQWFSFSGIETKETLELAKDVANGVIYSYPKYNTSDTLYSNFQSHYISKYQSLANLYTATTYDGIYLIAEVMKKYGTSSVEIQKGLRSIGSYNGIFGDIDFSHGGKQYVERELFWKKIENNQYKVLE
jgi:branched-chain amino acid transport system substrate-binding protein